jgi:hypothetical protein
LNMRFVRRLEKLTLRPNLVVLPQTSHLPATVRFLHDLRSMRRHHQNATPRASGKIPTWQGKNLRATLNHTMFLPTYATPPVTIKLAEAAKLLRLPFAPDA